MKFDKTKYLSEMEILLESAIISLKETHKDYKIYSVNIWTDPNAAVSAINFDSKENSDEAIKSANEFNKKYFDHYMQEGETEQAEFFRETITRNCNPADFELSQFALAENESFDKDWEENSEGECWDALESALKEFALIAIKKLKALNLHSEFELSVNGRDDWYMFTWN